MLAVGNTDGGVNAADAPVVYDEDVVLGYIDEIDTTISAATTDLNDIVSQANTDLNGIVSTATTNLNGIVSTANTDLNEIVDSAEDYVDEAKTSCANDKQSCQTIKSEVETIAGNMGNPVTNITFENGNLVIEKVKGDPVTVKISSPLDAYPVGSFYFSQNSINPATLFGGTWEQLEQGRVLLSQGTNYPAGSKGGEATHTLTVAEMPTHNHWVTPNVLLWAAASQRNEANQNLPPQVVLDSGSATSGTDGPYFIDRLIDSVRYVQDNGSSEAHNIMQPFISVYMFQRTA